MQTKKTGKMSLKNEKKMKAIQIGKQEKILEKNHSKNEPSKAVSRKSSDTGKIEKNEEGRNEGI